MSIFGTSVIRNRVIKAINEKIEKIEQEYLHSCDAIDVESENKKSALLENHVTSLLGKFL